MVKSLFPQIVTILPSKRHLCVNLKINLYTSSSPFSKKIEVAFPQLRVFYEWTYPGSVASTSHSLPRLTCFHTMHYYIKTPSFFIRSNIIQILFKWCKTSLISKQIFVWENMLEICAFTCKKHERLVPCMVCGAISSCF